MSARDALVALAGGERPGDRLLGSCRLLWGHSEAFGEEAVRELFRDAPLDLAAAILIETPTGAALLADDAALVADLYDGRIGRLWRVGSGEPPEPESYVAVAFDPDLRQERGGVYARREDHPDLADGAFEALVAASAVALDAPGTHRSRGFLLRAFGDDSRSVALVGVHRLAGGAVRGASFSHAVVMSDAEGARLVTDTARGRNWTPRL